MIGIDMVYWLMWYLVIPRRGSHWMIGIDMVYWLIWYLIIPRRGSHFFCFLFWDLVLSKFRKVIFFISCFKICFKMFSYILRGARCYSWGTVCWFWFSSWCNCFCLSSFLYFVICLLSLLFCILHNCVMIHHCFESSFDDSPLMHHDIKCAV